MAKMGPGDSVPNGLLVVQGELSTLLTVMRRPFKWSSRVYQEEPDPLLRNLTLLKEQLNKVSSLQELDLLLVLGPFLEVIRDRDISGPVTEIALSSVLKFLLYNLIDPVHDNAPIVVENLADAVTHARFVGTDAGSDEVVLMTIIQVLRKLVLHPVGIHLSNESICEIMQSCFRIMFEMRLSEIIRKTAEQSLSEMVHFLYSRLAQFPLQEVKGSVNYKKLKMHTAAYDPSRNKKKSRSSPKPKPKSLPPTANPPVQTCLPTEGLPNPCGEATQKENAEVTTPSEEPETKPSEEAQEPCEVETPSLEQVNSPVEGDMPSLDDKERVNPQGVRFVPSEESEDAQNGIHVPYGLPCVRELLRFLISLINPLEKQNTEVMIQIGLRLLTVAVETASDVIPAIPSLLSLIQDEACRSLFELLKSERLSVLSTACRLCFLLFESARTRLKLQLETYLVKLMEIVDGIRGDDTRQVPYEHRLVALEAIAQLCRIPGLLTELFLNYDCDSHTSDLFENLVKHLAKNASPNADDVYTIHLMSLDALLVGIDCIEAHCLCSQTVGNSEKDLKAVQLPPPARTSRFVDTLSEIPTHDQLVVTKNKKKLLIAGAEEFNKKPGDGIQFLVKNGLLSDPVDPTEVATFLRECWRLDKKMIGEYISNKKNLRILEAFVKSFDFNSVRIDEALRFYLETFRLPGEAPLINMLMEQFASHWFLSNPEAQFADADAAFTLAYAIIMLNVDQHNRNAKKQNIPMTPEDFKKNLSKVNGKQDFDPVLLEGIYTSIKSQEIVMPAEHKGLIKENYLWKMLLRRGATKNGHYTHATNGLFDGELFNLAWKPSLDALSCLFMKTPLESTSTIDEIVHGLRKMCTIAGHYNRSDIFDTIIQTLIDFTHLLSNNEQAVSFGHNGKAQLATITAFQMVQKYGDVMRQSWKPVVDCIMQFYRMRILPDELVEADDPLDPQTKIKLIKEETISLRESSSLFSSLYSYIASDAHSSGRVYSAEEMELIEHAKACVIECGIEQLIYDSKFLQTTALEQFLKVLMDLNNAAISSADEYTIVFVLEVIIRVTVQNRDRVTCIWHPVRDHIYSLLMGAAAAERFYVLERSTVGLLFLASRLMRREDIAPIILQSLRMLLLLKPHVLARVSRQVSYGLHELLKTAAANVHTTSDWRVLFTLLECVGAGAQPPSVREGDLPISPSMEVMLPLAESIPDKLDASSTDRGYTSDSELYENRRSSPGASGTHGSSPELNLPPGSGNWTFVNKQGEIELLKGKQAPGQEYSITFDRKLLGHDPVAFVKSCESLTFLVRDVAHITPDNFECAVQCIRTFVEASLHANKTRQQNQKRTDGIRRSKSVSLQSEQSSSWNFDDVPSNYDQVPIQLLDLMHTLHTRAARIYHEWAVLSDGDNQCNQSLWNRGWCPLLQGIARLCCDSRVPVRSAAINYLHGSVLVHDLQNLTAQEWESCFNTVLFPLLGKLLERQPVESPAEHWEETRTRAVTLLSKVFLQHYNALLELPTFTALWLTLLEFMEKYMLVEKSEQSTLREAVPELLKNMLLVMGSGGVFGTTDNEMPSPQTPQMKATLRNLTIDKLSTFVPRLPHEVDYLKLPVPVDQVPETESKLSESPPEPSQVSLEFIRPPLNEVEPPKSPVSEPELVKDVAETVDAGLNYVPASIWNVPSEPTSLFFQEMEPGRSESQPISIVPVSLINEDPIQLPIISPVFNDAPQLKGTEVRPATSPLPLLLDPSMMEPSITPIPIVTSLTEDKQS